MNSNWPGNNQFRRKRGVSERQTHMESTEDAGTTSNELFLRENINSGFA